MPATSARSDDDGSADGSRPATLPPGASPVADAQPKGRLGLTIPPMALRLPAHWRYATAFGSTLAALLIQISLLDRPGIAPFVFFFAAVALASWLGGYGPGLVSVALSAAIANYFFLGARPVWSTSGPQLRATALFLVAASLVAFLCASFRRSVLQAQATAAALRQQARMLELSHDALRESEQRTVARAAEAETATDAFRQDLTALRRMHALSGKLLQEGDLPSMLQAIMDAAVAIMRAEKGTLQLLEGESLRIFAHCGHREPFLQFFAAAENRASVCGEATRRGERVIVPDVEESPLFAGTPSLAVLREAGVRAVQSTPLMSRTGALLGILTTQWAVRYQPDQHDLWRLDLLARQAADIIDHKRAEDALREADRRKTEFLALLSHELRNPLAPITNSLYILEHAAPGGEQARRAQEVIGRQVGQLVRMVDDLLEVTRITRGRIKLLPQRLELNDLMRRTIEDHRSLFETSGVRLVFEPASRPAFVSADPNRLAQVIGNLLSNAGKFTPRSGRVTVSVDADSASRQAILRVADNGAGIPPQTLARLFEPFTQADTTLDRSGGGLGLGLALVRGLVEQHGGTVAAKSDGVGRGAEFTIQLPLLPADTVGEEQEPPLRALPRRRVLVIEDNADAADSLRELLEIEGHCVAVAYDGAEGIARARAFRPEVVLCDIGLPRMDGYQVARAFQADEQLQSVRLVALSGYALPEDLERAAAAGFERHLAKPPNLDRLREVLGAGRSTD